MQEEKLQKLEWPLYRTAEIAWQGEPPAGPEALAAPEAVFAHADGETVRVRGFYRGGGMYAVRFLPEKAGEWTWSVEGLGRGSAVVTPAEANEHGPVRAKGAHLWYADGTPYTAFGTTVYALASQEDGLVRQTLDTLRRGPFNKVRLCVFPKHYDYNRNEPPFYAFERREDGSWDVERPCYAFWDLFESRLEALGDMGIQADLILFHPYDRWGFASLPQEDNLTYLDYLLRRFAAYGHIWWSLANEYDLCPAKTEADWRQIEEYVAAHDPFRHLLSCHNCFQPWDPARPNITHMSWQTKQLTRVGEMMRRYGKPVLVDECCYEGNIQHFWGNISGREMTRRFWRAVTLGGGCTHGETFIDPEPLRDNDPARAEAYRADAVLWWAKGGRLVGESPARIAFLRSIVEELPGPLEESRDLFRTLFALSDAEMEAKLADGSVPEGMRPFLAAMARLKQPERDRFASVEYTFAGRVEDSAFLWYLDTQCCAFQDIALPEGRRYRVEILDTWEMTRAPFREDASGATRVFLPGKPYMAILATAAD